jgi:RNA polymerase sigma-70 factor (ECF subfamily)
MHSTNAAIAVAPAPGEDSPAAPAAPAVLQYLAEYRDAALRFALRMTGNAQDAEDVVQEAFVRLIHMQERLRPGPQARVLLLRIVANVARNEHVSNRRRMTRERNYAAGTEQICKKDFTGDNLRQAVDKALLTLNENLRLSVCLHYEQGLSYAEASAVLNVPEETLRKHAQRGLSALRTVLTRQGYALTPAVLLALLGESFQTLPTGAQKLASAVRRNHKIRVEASTRLKPMAIGLAAAVSIAAGLFALAPNSRSAPVTSAKPVAEASILQNKTARPSDWIAIDGTVTANGKSARGDDGQSCPSITGEQRRVKLLIPHGEKAEVLQSSDGPLKVKKVIGSLTVYDPDGSVLIDARQQEFIVRTPQDRSVAAVIQTAVNWKSLPGTLSVFVGSDATGANNVAVVVDTYLEPHSPAHCAFYHQGILSGSVVVRP